MILYSYRMNTLAVKCRMILRYRLGIIERVAEPDPAEVKAVLAFIRDHPGVPYREVERTFLHNFGRVNPILGYLAEMKFIAYRVQAIFDSEKGTIDALCLYPR